MKIGQVVYTFDSIHTKWSGRVLSFDETTVAIIDKGHISFVPLGRVFENTIDLEDYIRITYNK